MMHFENGIFQVMFWTNPALLAEESKRIVADKSDPCADPESFVRGGQTLTKFFCFG